MRPAVLFALFLTQTHPAATPQQVKAALLAAARPNTVHERDVGHQIGLTESPAAADPVT
jgi:hypothetical protein